MKKFLALSALLILSFSLLSMAEETGRVLFDFSGNTVEENQITLKSPEFGTSPQADVTFGAIPTNNAFVGATDGKGMIIQADPGEGVLVLTRPILTTHCAFIRCSVRTSASNASVYLASLDQGESTFVSTLSPNNSTLFVNQYKRLADFFLPPSTGFQAIVQVVNTSQTEKLTAYVDNLEVVILGKDNIELAVSEITDSESAPIATPTPAPPTPTPTPTVIPTPVFTNETITIDLSLPEGAKPWEMVLIPAGTFIMGSWSTSGVPHQVTISKPFYLSKYEITQAQWKAVMGSSSPSKFEGNNLPVEQVSWYDCLDFIKKLRDFYGRKFRLPTEAEWEYACRAGTTTTFYWGEDSNYSQTGQYAWYGGNSSSQTHEVGTKLPNVWGLFDMNGNVREWCDDWYEEILGTDAQIDPTGAERGTYKVIRGGSWYYGGWECRSAHRHYNGSSYWSGDIGFRLVKTQ